MVFYSIGHSNHPAAYFIELLRIHDIEALADVRSVPSSRHAPQFGQHVLGRALREAGIEYLYLGQELGGRPQGDEYYDTAGHVLYGRFAESKGFQTGLVRLIELAAQRRTAVMCAEEDPARCHRHLLIGRVLGEGGATILHIRKDGTTNAADSQPALFEDDLSWRSPSVIKRPAPQTRTGLRGRPTAT